jgi:hypothetical protein
MLVISGSESPIEVRGLAEYPSHGGSQGFKSPHLHPTTALVTGLAGRSRRAGAVLDPAVGQQTGRTANETAPQLDRGHDDVVKQGQDFPTFRFRVGCSASIWSAPDGSGLLTLTASSVQTDPDGSRRIVWMIRP